jgi:hypothetical protein
MPFSMTAHSNENGVFPHSLPEDPDDIGVLSLSQYGFIPMMLDLPFTLTVQYIPNK